MLCFFVSTVLTGAFARLSVPLGALLCAPFCISLRAPVQHRICCCLRRWHQSGCASPLQAGAELHRSLKVQAELLERLQAVEAAAGQQAVQSAELPRALRAEATATHTNAAAAITDGGDGGEAGDGGSVASRRLPERQTGMDARDVAPSAAAATSGNVSAATLVPARIAVVVIAYNRPEYLEQALRCGVLTPPPPRSLLAPFSLPSSLSYPSPLLAYLRSLFPPALLLPLPVLILLAALLTFFSLNSLLLFFHKI
eukprot:6190804-Pleurochrysis_carterae.AAC.2